MRLILKILMVFVLTIAIVIPLMMIQGTIQERKYYLNEVVATVARSNAGAQGLSGPVLVVPYTETIEVEEKNDKGEVIRKVKRDGESGQWVFFPTELDLRGTIRPDNRSIGLHQVRVYDADIATVATYRVEIPADANPDLPRKFGRPWLAYGIRDVRGLAGLPRLKIDGEEARLERGLGYRDASGVHLRLETPRAGDVLAPKVEISFALEGMESLAVAPLGERNTVVLDSPWQHPQFNGAFSPRKREIDAKGFRGEWEVSALASNAQAQYLAGQILPAVVGDPSARAHGGYEGDASGAQGGSEGIGVSLVDPVNVYSMTDRATKYGILFVLLTFVGFFMFETIKRLRIHPIQYGLVGLALAIFFLLLVALSERIDFGIAYLSASAACIGLLGYYVSHVLQSWWRGLGFAAMLGTLYAALYGLLISEDNAMVLGAGLLFLVLAAIMVVTRKVDWYAVAQYMSEPPRRAAATPPPMPPVPPAQSAQSASA